MHDADHHHRFTGNHCSCGQPRPTNISIETAVADGVEQGLLHGVFPEPMLRRELLRTAGASAIIGALSSILPLDALKAIAESAARLCKAEFCSVFRFDGELIHFMHSYGYSREAIEDLRHFYPMRPGRGSCAGRAILNGKVEQVPDVRADPEYAQGNVPDIMKISSVIAVPMLKEHRPVGAIALVRAAKGTFPQRQIDLLKTFADQAVIAIENARLFNEVQARTRELAQSLDDLRTAQDRLIQTEKLAPLVSRSLQEPFRSRLECRTAIRPSRLQTEHLCR